MNIFFKAKLFLLICIISLFIKPVDAYLMTDPLELFEYAINGRTPTDLQKIIMKNAIGLGLDLNHIIETKYQQIPLDVLYNHKESFLEYLSPNNFLKLTLKSKIKLLEDFEEQLDPIQAKQQNELLQLALKKGANLIENFDFFINAINIDTLDNNKEILLNEIGPDAFLILSVHSIIYLSRPTQKTKQLNLAKLALDLGANPNHKINGIGVTLSRSFEPTIELLELLIDHGAKNTMPTNRLSELSAAGLEHILFDPEFVIKQKYKNLNAEESIEPKIPYIIHHIWLTHPSSPREIREQDLENVIATKNLFSQGSAQWQHILWTNDSKLFPKSVSKLKEAGIEIKSIYAYQEELQLFEIIETLIEQKLWGKASDTLRISLLEHFGGVYSDLNYIFHRETTSEAHKYHFFTSTYKDAFIANFLIGSCAKHPILQTTLSLIERNLTTPPDYLKDVQNENQTPWVTSNPLYLAYYLEANRNGNIDVIYPSTSYHRRKKMNPHYHEEKEKHILTPEQDKVEKLLQKTCPMATFDEAIHSKEMCATIDQFIGYDSSDGTTWIE